MYNYTCYQCKITINTNKNIYYAFDNTFCCEYCRFIFISINKL